MSKENKGIERASWLSEELIEQEGRLFSNAFDHAAIGMALVAPDGTWLRVNNSLCDLLGYSAQELMSKTFQDITYPEDLDEDLVYVNQMLAGSIDSYQMEKRYFHKDGRLINVLLSVSLVWESDDKPLFFISQIQDITRRKQLEDELAQLAQKDALTQVANRRYFMEHATREMTRGDRFREPQSILMIDIDHFKRVNDTYGHDVGDQVLISIATGCSNALREFDIFGRLGGEEFGALLLNTDAEAAQTLAERLRARAEEIVVETEKGPVRVTVSIGLVSFLGGGEPIESRLKTADAALYKAKDAGRNRVVAVVESSAAGDEPRERIRKSFVRLQWDQGLESGNLLIDSQHRSLFAISNDLLAAIITGQPNAEVERLCANLISHTAEHFHDEEAIFRTAGYLDADRHAEIHKGLVTSMQNVVSRFHSGDVSIGELFEFLICKVVRNHMLNEDTKFFPYL